MSAQRVSRRFIHSFIGSSDDDTYRICAHEYTHIQDEWIEAGREVNAEIQQTGTQCFKLQFGVYVYMYAHGCDVVVHTRHLVQEGGKSTNAVEEEGAEK